MWFGIVTIFPEMFSALNSGVTSRAQKEKIIQLQCFNPRDFTTDRHQSVDDNPYGGGPGMVMMPEPLQAAIQAANDAAPVPPTVIFLSPQGRQFDQKAAERLAEMKSVVMIAGRYEGIDERIIESEVDEEWSIGDFILTGGELAAMVMIDAASRLLPGVVGDDQSVATDSLTSGLLKYPQYTRPEIFAGLPVPPVLMSGHHAEIRRWRLKMSLGRTWMRRPDLLAKLKLSKEEQALLDEFIDDIG
ncbi:MAG TPA: tRNA (guanosine(37)-N1)-methyltransferase TrmD [Gammaproteobacteria bacterium]|jgi:tRNA (guanine37-N1)-methyltransferase|nr:tRNA (guanosine(37)-N1)-methyltransferase TrmD [Gammaproteobacteria bacterium]